MSENITPCVTSSKSVIYFETLSNKTFSEIGRCPHVYDKETKLTVLTHSNFLVVHCTNPFLLL